MQVGLIGTGLLGTALARRLLAHRVPLLVYNRTPERTAPLVAAGAGAAASPAELLQAADPVVLVLADATAIRDTVFAAGARDALRGRTLIQMGTIAPGESVAFAEEARARGGDWLEAPVLGSVPQALDGKLIVMFGGSPGQLGRWSGLLEHWGPPPLRIGPVGSAATLKLALNQLIASLTVAYAQSLALVRRSGLDVETFAGILRRSALYAPTFDKKLGAMLSGAYGDPHFPTRHLLKDMDLFLAEADAQGITAFAAEGVRRTIVAALGAGAGDRDYAAVYEAVDRRAQTA